MVVVGEAGWGRGKGKLLFNGVEFQLGKIKFWRWVVVMVAKLNIFK